MIRLPPGAFDDGTTRTLLALVAVHGEDGRATVRRVAARAGLTLSVAYRHLRALRAVGLVAWEDGRNGSLRPLARRVR